MEIILHAVTRPRGLSSGRLTAIAASAAWGLCVAAVVAAPSASADPLPPPGPPPTGGNPIWQALAQSCFQGSMQACDHLYDQTNYSNAPESQAYLDYAHTCGFRSPPLPSNQYYVNYCQDDFPGHP